MAAAMKGPQARAGFGQDRAETASKIARKILVILFAIAMNLSLGY